MAYPKSYKLVWKNNFGKLAVGGFPTPESANFYRAAYYPDSCDIEPAFFDEVYRDEKGSIVKEIGNVRIS